MKILVITEYFRASCSNGAEVFAKELIAALKKKHAIHVLAHATENDLPGLDIPIPADVYSSIDKLREFLYERVVPGNYDLVYNLGGLLFGCFIVRYLEPLFSSVPLVNHFQVLFAPLAEKENMTNAKQDLISKPQLHAASLAALNIFVSANELRSAMQYGFPLNRSSIAIIHNGISTGEQTDQGPAFDIPLIDGKRPLVFMAAGRFSEHSKGADILFRAFKRLWHDRNDIYLITAGPSEKYRFILNEVPEQNYRLLPWLPREELLNLLHYADIALVPSRYEPFGLIAVEAMSCGLPVIANDTGGLSEIIHHKRTGLLNPARNGWLGFYKCMKELAGHEQERRAMGIESKKTVFEKFTIDHVAMAVDHHLCRAVLSHRTLEPGNQFHHALENDHEAAVAE
jgi:glycosyltransferase involved in cell wall biosynthesis